MHILKALFFDFDGVLFDLEPVHFKAWQQTLKKLGVKEIGLTLNQVIGISDWEMGESFIKKFTLPLSLNELLNQKRQDYQKILPSYSFDTTLLKDILTKLHHNFTLLIVSSSHTEEILQLLETHDLQCFFSHIIGGNSVTHHKPHPEAYLLALKKSHLQPSQALAIEDSEAGLQSATSAGLKAIWCNTYHQSPTPFFKQFPTCSSLNEIPLLLKMKS